jgi:NitT/TauT family transport system substrate-binding protein
VLGAHESLLEGNLESVRAFLAVTDRGYRAAAEDPEHALAVLERVVAYFPQALLARSLELITPTWFHDAAWGEPRAALMQPYAAWLAEHGILRNADWWAQSTTAAFLPVAA